MTARKLPRLADLDTRDPHCVRCYGSGWVCENHPTRPWRDGPYYEQWAGDNACNCGAGMPCPDCNKLAMGGAFEMRMR